MKITIEYCSDAEHYNQFKVVYKLKNRKVSGTGYIDVEAATKLFEELDDGLTQHFTHNRA